MTDYTKLVKALRYCKVDYCSSCLGCPMYADYEGNGCINEMHDSAAAAIEELKAIAHSHCVAASAYWEELEELKAQLPKRGEWIHGREIGKEWMYDHWVAYYEDWHCSNCKVVFEQEEKPKYNYCPNCGAKMEVQDG